MQFNHIPTPWFKPTNFDADTHADGKRFYFNPEIPSERYPSVTTVLQDYKKDILDKWRKRVGAKAAGEIAEKARVRGDAFHEMMERYIANEPLDSFLPNFSDYHRITFRRAQRAIDLNVKNIHIQEQPLFSKTLKIAGRVDLIAEWSNVLSVIDFKGANKQRKEEWIDNYKLQCAMYAFAYFEMTGIVIKQMVIIMSGDDQSLTIYKDNPSKWIVKAKMEVEKFHKTFSQTNPL